ncbi:hypothetical protein Pcinc_038315, partial [Petrolisthes cinctipes]
CKTRKAIELMDKATRVTMVDFLAQWGAMNPQ